jgi:regulatory protein
MKVTPSAYLDGLKLLAQRELSEARIRERLARRGHAPDTIDEAVARLRAERAIDDARVAATIARNESSGRRRGKLRVRMDIERAGIAGETADRAVADAFETIDDDTLLEACIDKRLHGRRLIADDRELQRLYRYLAGQGFESEQILRALAARKRRP